MFISETTKGVPPLLDINLTFSVVSEGNVFPAASERILIASDAPFRILKCSKSIPLLRVSAVNFINLGFFHF